MKLPKPTGSRQAFTSGKLLLGLLLSLATPPAEHAVADQSSNARIERIRRDLGYYQTLSPDKADELSAEIQALKQQLEQDRAREDQRIQHIEGLLKAHGDQQVAPVPAATAAPASAPAAVNAGQPPQPANAITVCSQGCDFSDLQKAVDAVPAGGEIDVSPEINGSCAVIAKPVHLVGKRRGDGKRAHLPGGVCQGKGPLITAAADIVIEGFEISNVNVPSNNGACIRLDPGTRNLTIRDIYCHDNQEGLLGASDGRLLIEDSVFVGNGLNGSAHGLYISGGDEAVIRRTHILSSHNSGHSLKSGARKLRVEDSVIAALNGNNSRALDLYAGGDIVLLRNVIQQGPNSENSDVIGLGMQTANLFADGHYFRMDGNWVIADPQGRSILFRGQKLGPVVLQNNKFVGLKGVGLDGVAENGDQWFTGRNQAGLPEFDGTPACLPESVKPK